MSQLHPRAQDMLIRFDIIDWQKPLVWMNNQDMTVTLIDKTSNGNFIIKLQRGETGKVYHTIVNCYGHSLEVSDHVFNRVVNKEDKLDWTKPCYTYNNGYAVAVIAEYPHNGNKIVTWIASTDQVYAFVTKEGKLLATLHDGTGNNESKFIVNTKKE